MLLILVGIFTQVGQPRRCYGRQGTYSYVQVICWYLGVVWTLLGGGLIIAGALRSLEKINPGGID